MDFIPDKPFKNMGEQISLLQERGLKINNMYYAYLHLSNIGYYPLINGYGKMFLSDVNDNIFDEKAELEYIAEHYRLDRDLKQILFQRIIDCENKLKTALGYVVADSFGVYDRTEEDSDYIEGTPSFLEKRNYVRNRFLNKTIGDIKKTRNQTKSNPTAHYRKTKNHIPPWILFRNISFWNSICLFKSLKGPEKQKIVPMILMNYTDFTIDIQTEIIVNCFEILRYFRNDMAHGSRMYILKADSYLLLPAVEKTLGPKVLTPTEYSSSLGKNDFFSLLLSIVILTDDFIELLELIEDLKRVSEKYSLNKKFLIEYKNISTYESFVQISGLPFDYIDRLEEAVTFKIDKLIQVS